MDLETCVETLKKDADQLSFEAEQKNDLMLLIKVNSFQKTTTAGLQIIFQNLSDIMFGRNKIPSDIYENLSEINFYKNFIKF